MRHLEFLIASGFDDNEFEAIQVVHARLAYNRLESNMPFFLERVACAYLGTEISHFDLRLANPLHRRASLGVPIGGLHFEGHRLVDALVYNLEGHRDHAYPALRSLLPALAEVVVDFLLPLEGDMEGGVSRHAWTCAREHVGWVV